MRPDKVDRLALGARLREAREVCGLTQVEVAERMHVAPSTIARYESGTRIPGVEEIPEYARVLRVSISWIMGEETEDHFRDREAAVWYNGLPPILRTAARAQLKALYDAADAEEEAVIGRKAG